MEINKELSMNIPGNYNKFFDNYFSHVIIFENVLCLWYIFWVGIRLGDWLIKVVFTNMYIKDLKEVDWRPLKGNVAVSITH